MNEGDHLFKHRHIKQALPNTSKKRKIEKKIICLFFELSTFNNFPINTIYPM